MMNLHIDRETFTDIIDTVSEETGIARDIIEKDYYVTMVLKEFFHDEQGLVFKGGTGNLVNSLIAAAISMFGTAALVYFFGFDKNEPAVQKQVK